MLCNLIYEDGRNYPAVAIPLVALGTQRAIIDVFANAIVASFYVHGVTVRGL